jgi:pyrimidine deaminase RibD-like protein
MDLSRLGATSMSKHLLKAVKVASRSKCRHKHGCVVVSRGQVVASATNQRVGNPEDGWRRSHIHAEHAALMAAGEKAYGATVYVARVSASGQPVESKPCRKCERLLEKFKVGAVVWT